MLKKYNGMYKQYFILKNKEEAAALANELYNHVSSISSDLKIGNSPAFILYCDEILHELQAIRSMNLQISLLSEDVPTVALHQFINHAIIEEIHQTNEMENVQSTRKEIKDELKVIENGKKGKRFDGMIRKYKLLLDNPQIPLSSCQDIRNLYDSFVLEEVKREKPSDVPDGLFFRKDPVAVIRHNDTIHEGVFPESALNEAMEQALLLLNNDDYDPLIRIAAFHYLFGYIHPFYNGNGRMTRFISSYRLSANRIHILVALRLSLVIKSHQSQYYSMFKTTNDSRNYGDMTCFVIDFLRFVHEACEQVLSYLQEKKHLIDHYRIMIQQLNLDENAKQLLYVLAQVSICESDSLIKTEMKQTNRLSYFLLNKYLAEIKPYLIISKEGKKTLSYRADLQKLDKQYSLSSH